MGASFATTRSIGLDEVAAEALRAWLPRREASRKGGHPAFGAAGMGGFDVDPGLTSHLGRITGLYDDPFNRMVGTDLGQKVYKRIGNEGRSQAAIMLASVEIMAEALSISGQSKKSDRLLLMPPVGTLPPVVMRLSPEIAAPSETRVISSEVDLSIDLLTEAVFKVRDGMKNALLGDAFGPEREVVESISETSQVAQLFLISQPEVLLSRLPKMRPLCVPAPYLKVSGRGDDMISTAGIYCRDPEGVLGVTACYHGTGPKGTEVTVDGQPSRVKSASEVQDLVFIPLPPNAGLPGAFVGRGGFPDEAPGQDNAAHFDGATNHNKDTHIISVDKGVLRPRAEIMLKLQTAPDTDQGDSGSALINKHNQVLGFAFQQTEPGEREQFTDWIWAANALRALKLVAYRAGV